MIKYAFALVPMLAAGSVSGEQTSAIAAAARSVLEKCGGIDQQLASQPDTTWARQSDALQKHAALRSALGEAMPHTRPMVLIYAQGGHLATDQHSIVLERRQNGRWLGTAVGRGKIWVQDAPYTPFPPKQWILSAENGQRLDRILGSACFYAEPTEFVADRQGPPALGAMAVYLDVVTATRRRTSFFLGGEAKGLTAEVVELATPT